MTKISSKQCPGIHWKCNSVDETMVPRDPTWFRPCKHTFGSCSHITISHVRQHTIHGPSICISHRLYRLSGYHDRWLVCIFSSARTSPKKWRCHQNVSCCPNTLLDTYSTADFLYSVEQKLKWKRHGISTKLSCERKVGLTCQARINWTDPLIHLITESFLILLTIFL